MEPYAAELAGFVVQRLTSNGQSVGFRAVTLESGFPPPFAEYVPGQDGVFILRGKWDASALETAILSVERLSHDPGKKLILLDEIGGIELTSRVFMDALERILSGSTPCIGTFKSRENFAHTSSVLKLTCRNEHRELEQRLKKWLAPVTEQNYDEVRERLRSIIAEKG